MALSYSILGQTGDASTETDLYTAPALKNVKIKITIANRGAAATFRVSISPDGGATGAEDYVAYDKPISANESLTSTTFIVNAADVVRVMASTADVTFMVYGIEQDQT
jgi:hypothetical protein